MVSQKGLALSLMTMAADRPLSPRPTASSFRERLAQANGLNEQGFQGWCWREGMRFGANRTWWGRATARPRPHEGLDLGLFVDAAGMMVGSLGAGALVPVLLAGQVVAVFVDFMGQSIMVAHEARQEEWRLHSIYAHVLPASGVAVGHRCHSHEIIARIAPSPKPGVPAHLHLSTLWLSGSLPATISWPWISDSTAIRLCDPLEFIDIQVPVADHPRHAE